MKVIQYVVDVPTSKEYATLVDTADYLKEVVNTWCEFQMICMGAVKVVVCTIENEGLAGIDSLVRKKLNVLSMKVLK